MVGSRVACVALVVACACSTTTKGVSGPGDDAGGSDAAAVGIPTNDLYLWLDATRGTNADDSGGISRWEDQTPHALHAEQGLASARPRLVDTPEGPALDFDGEGDALILPEGFEDVAGGLTIFVVTRPNSLEGCRQLVQWSNGPEVDDISLHTNGNGDVMYEVDYPFATIPEGALESGRTTLVTVVHEVPGTARLRLDGAPVLAEGVEMPLQIPRTTNFVGNGLYESCTTWSGAIHEIVVYTAPLASEDVDAVEGYLRGKWSCCGG